MEPLLGSQVIFAVRTVRETVESLLDRSPVEAEDQIKTTPPPAPAAVRSDAVRLGMQVLVSLVLLSFGIYILAADAGSQGLQNAAIAWLGALVGYWLH